MFILQTDASERGIGVVLSPRDDDGTDYPLVYFSKKLLPHEERYSTIKEECFAIKLGMQNFSMYLHCKNELVILTLIWLQEFQCFIDNKYYASET